MLLGRIIFELNITSPALIKGTVERNSGKCLLKVLYNLKDVLAKYRYTVLNMNLLNIPYNFKISQDQQMQ